MILARLARQRFTERALDLLCYNVLVVDALWKIHRTFYLQLQAPNAKNNTIMIAWCVCTRCELCDSCEHCVISETYVYNCIFNALVIYYLISPLFRSFPGSSCICNFRILTLFPTAMRAAVRRDAAIQNEEVGKKSRSPNTMWALGACTLALLQLPSSFPIVFLALFFRSLCLHVPIRISDERESAFLQAANAFNLVVMLIL